MKYNLYFQFTLLYIRGAGGGFIGLSVCRYSLFHTPTGFFMPLLQGFPSVFSHIKIATNEQTYLQRKAERSPLAKKAP